MDIKLFAIFALTYLDFLSHIKCDSHTFDSSGHTHSTLDDQKLFLGEKLKKEFDTLSLDESRRRLR